MNNYAQFVPVIQGNRVAIGAAAWHKKDGQKIPNGAVFIYEKSPAGWTSMTESYELKVNAGKFVPVLGLGVSVALQGREILAGAPGTVLDKQQEAGAAFLFKVNKIGETTPTEFACQSFAGRSDGLTSCR